MIVLRSIMLTVVLSGWAVLLSAPLTLLMVLPRRGYLRCALACCRSSIAIARGVAGIGYEVRGSEFLPEGPAILASKHQSAWDTLIYNVLVPDCAYVVKRELMLLPFFGWALCRLGMIGVDREGGARALKDLVAKAQRRVGEGRSVVIFPQGTRTPPGADRPYVVGVAAIYRQCGVPIVPVALNSGLFWPRRKLLKVPGTITVEFLPPIEPGLDRDTFMATLRGRIEPASDRLEADARARLAPVAARR